MKSNLNTLEQTSGMVLSKGKVFSFRVANSPDITMIKTFNICINFATAFLLITGLPPSEII